MKLCSGAAKAGYIGQHWFLNLVAQTLKDRDATYRNWKACRSDASRQNFKIKRNKAALEIRKAKSKYCFIYFAKNGIMYNYLFFIL